ncbi:MAG: hypothetical protein QHC65_13665 [Sphingomonas sp.]|nr:hypothetical protein [Sphingomonas sp.]MDX3885464.1 hypothetical protein [Sphingomonas sp.]
MNRRIDAAARQRVAMLIAALRETAEAELPAGLAVEGRDDGIAISGPGLARRLAYDGSLRGLAFAMRGMRRRE